MNLKFVILAGFMGLVLLFPGGENVLSQEQHSYQLDTQQYGTSYEDWTQMVTMVTLDSYFRESSN
jgi:hypothetical protein